MTRFRHLQALKPISDLVKDRELAAFSKAQRERDAILSQLAALGDPQPAPRTQDLPHTFLAQAEDMHLLWRTQRRMALNAALARSSADWMETREKAKQAFGRAAMIDHLLAERRR